MLLWFDNISVNRSKNYDGKHSSLLLRPNLRNWISPEGNTFQILFNFTNERRTDEYEGKKASTRREIDTLRLLHAIKKKSTNTNSHDVFSSTESQSKCAQAQTNKPREKKMKWTKWSRRRLAELNFMTLLCLRAKRLNHPFTVASTYESRYERLLCFSLCPKLSENAFTSLSHNQEQTASRIILFIAVLKEMENDDNTNGTQANA